MTQDSSDVDVLPGWSRWERWAVAALFVLHALICFQGISEDFLVGHHGWAGSIRGAIGSNYDEVGFLKTGLRPFKDFGPLDDLKKGHVHWHHPPGINLMVGASIRVFGESNAAVKLVPITAALISFWMLFFLVRRRYGPLAACCSVAVFMLLPMQTEYGKFINYEPLVATLGLMSLLMLERLRAEGLSWSKAHQRAMIALICLTLMAAGFVDWTGFMIAGVLGFDALVRKPRQARVFFAVGVTTTLFLVWVWWWLSLDAPKDALLNLGKYRATAKFTNMDYIGRLAGRVRDYYLLLPCLIASFWVAIRTWRDRAVDPVVFVFLGTNVIYALGFRQATWVHNFYLYFLVPVVAVGAGAGVAQFLEALDSRRHIALALTFACVLWVATIADQYTAIHNRSYQVHPPGRRSRGFPLDGRVDQVVLGKWLGRELQAKERYVIDPRIPATMGMRYYAARHYRKSRAVPVRPRNNEAFFVTHMTKFSKADQKKWAAKYPVTRLMDYLIYDLRKPGETGVRALALKSKPKTLLHTYFVSSFYPPYELVNAPSLAKKSRKAWGL